MDLCCKEFGKVNVKKCNYTVIPGWNKNVKELYIKSREDYIKWLQKGKQKDSTEYHSMVQSRKVFKAALKKCKENEKNEMSQSVQEKFADKNMMQFWKEIKSQSNRVKTSNIIDGTGNTQDIIDIFEDKFLSKEKEENEKEREFLRQFKPYWENNRKFHAVLSVERVQSIMKKLNKGVGHDGLHSTFLKKCSHRLLSVLVSLLNACYTHCYIPTLMLTGDITPVIKDSKGNCSDSNNYRPVMVSSCLLKILELHLYDILEEKIFYDFKQFGFTRGLSTSDTCLIFKEIVRQCMANRNSAYACFMHLSKTFDEVNHVRLGNILMERGLPPDIVLLLMHYMYNQFTRVTWNVEKGKYFKIYSGLRQGGILSPMLFKLYIDDVLRYFNSIEKGCQVGSQRTNIIAYADDVAILADNKNNLLHLCDEFQFKIKELKLNINQKKSKCMIFSNTPAKDDRYIGEYEVVDSYKYLGHVIQNNLDDIKDVELRLNSFYGSFNCIFRKFSNVNPDTLLFLFKAYCLPNIGLSAWNIRTVESRKMFKTLAIAYSDALKKMYKVPRHFSNHKLANDINFLLFNHYTVYVQCRYFKSLIRKNNWLINIGLPYLGGGYYYNNFRQNLFDKYNVKFEECALEILLSRLSWVQHHESCTGHVT